MLSIENNTFLRNQKYIFIIILECFQYQIMNFELLRNFFFTIGNLVISAPCVILIRVLFVFVPIEMCNSVLSAGPSFSLNAGLGQKKKMMDCQVFLMTVVQERGGEESQEVAIEWVKIDGTNIVRPNPGQQASEDYFLSTRIFNGGCRSIRNCFMRRNLLGC